MTQKFTALELAVLNLMKANLEISLRTNSQNRHAHVINEVTREDFHTIINEVVPCEPETLKLTANMLAHEGLLAPVYNERTGKKEGFLITKEGLVALRSTL